jgi:hypothetical protein
MNAPCWEAGGWTALVGGNPTEPIGRSRVNDMSGNATRVGVSERSRGDASDIDGQTERSKWAGAHESTREVSEFQFSIVDSD